MCCLGYIKFSVEPSRLVYRGGVNVPGRSLDVGSTSPKDSAELNVDVLKILNDVLDKFLNQKFKTSNPSDRQELLKVATQFVNTLRTPLTNQLRPVLTELQNIEASSATESDKKAAADRLLQGLNRVLAREPQSSSSDMSRSFYGVSHGAANSQNNSQNNPLGQLLGAGVGVLNGALGGLQQPQSPNIYRSGGVGGGGVPESANAQNSSGNFLEQLIGVGVGLTVDGIMNNPGMINNMPDALILGSLPTLPYQTIIPKLIASPDKLSAISNQKLALILTHLPYERVMPILIDQPSRNLSRFLSAIPNDKLGVILHSVRYEMLMPAFVTLPDQTLLDILSTIHGDKLASILHALPYERILQLLNDPNLPPQRVAYILSNVDNGKLTSILKTLPYDRLTYALNMVFIPPEKLVGILLSLPDDKKGLVLNQLPYERLMPALRNLPPQNVAAILSAVPDDVLVRILHTLPPQFITEFKKLPSKMREEIISKLSNRQITIIFNTWGRKKCLEAAEGCGNGFKFKTWWRKKGWSGLF